MIKYFEDDLNLVLDNTKDYWKEIENKTIFITGGTGFFGIWLIMSFIFINRKLNLNSKIIILTRNKEKFINKYEWINEYSEIIFLEGDVTSFDFIHDQIDYIIHAATEASLKLNIEEPLTMFETIVSGTKRVLEFARIKKVDSVLFTSSGAVYGAQPTTISNIKEDYNGAPIVTDLTAVYGEGKRMAEVLCSVYHKHYGLSVKVARCYAFIGPLLPLNTHFAAGNFIQNVLDGDDIIIEGDGTPTRSYMYSADLAVWLWTILFKGSKYGIYNVGSDKAISILELAKVVSKCDNSQLRKIIVKSPKLNKSIIQYVPSIDKAKEELKLNIYTDLETSIIKTIKYNKLKI